MNHPGFFDQSRLRATPFLLSACMALAVAQPLQAELACPVRLSDGKIDQGTISIRFMNGGKTPIRELNLDCTALGGGKAEHKACHSESGIFYPGTPYTVRFAYTGKAARSIEVSVNSAGLLNGSIWSSSQDQPCRPLKIVTK
jgi:hypothetical protein